MDRRERILEHIRPGMKGIEIGPYFAPLLPKAEGWDVLVLDVQDADRLRQRAARDPAIPPATIDRIEAVDLLGPAQRMAELAEAAGHAPGSFDFVVSSHNFEHLPDPLRFLQAVETVLKPCGVLSMAVPDKRFCFDMLRPRSTLGAILDAYFERREQPGLRQHFEALVDFVALVPGEHAPLSSEDALRGGQVREILQEQLARWQERIEAGGMPYRDAHCWTFTPASAELILRDLHFLELTRLELLSCSEPYGHEFYLHLRQAPGIQPPARAPHYERRRRLLQRIAEEEDAHGWRDVAERASVQALNREADALRRELARLGGERAAMLASRSWRLTAPLRALAHWLRPGRSGAGRG